MVGSQEKVDDAQLKGHRGAGEASHKEEEVGGGIIGESKGSTNSSGGTRRACWEVLGTSQSGRIKASIVEVEVRRSEGHWSLVRLATSEPVSGHQRGSEAYEPKWEILWAWLAKTGRS